MQNPALRGQDPFDRLRINPFDRLRINPFNKLRINHFGRLRTSSNPPLADFGCASTCCLAYRFEEQDY